MKLPPGHNGGPPLDEPARSHRQCRWCRHWRPPLEADARAYDYYRLGLSRRWVRRPRGACDRVLLVQGRPLAFSAITAEQSCLNFEAKPPSVRVSGGGFVTVYEGERMIWSGAEEDLPEHLR